jgi:hypothetical protein
MSARKINSKQKFFKRKLYLLKMSENNKRKSREEIRKHGNSLELSLSNPVLPLLIKLEHLVR